MVKVLTRDRVYDFTQSFIAQNGYVPSVREIMTGVGLRSTSIVHAHIENLVKEGRISKGDVKARAIRPKLTSADSVDVLKTEDNTPTVIRWQGRIYILEWKE